MIPSLHESKKRLRSLLTYMPLRIRASRALARTSLVAMDGFTLKVPEGVFHPQYFYSSKILLKELHQLDLRDKYVLDMGTGSGILALAAASQGAAVLAVDVNPLAAKAAAVNVAANGFGERVFVRASNLFDQIGDKKFDLIVWNPPFYPKPSVGPPQAAWDAGDSYEIIRQFAATAGDHLRPDGTCTLIFSNDMDIPLIVGVFAFHGFRSSVPKTYRRFLESFEVRSFSLQDRS